MKNVRLEFDNIDKEFVIPALKIADIRGRYFTDRDLEKGDITQEEYDETLNKEINYALSDEFELIDWVQNNMNWEDVLPLGKWDEQSGEGDPDMQQEFLSSTVSITSY